MTRTTIILIGGFGLLLTGAGLLGTALGVRATIDDFGNLEIGAIMAGYYAGYIVGTDLAPRVIRNVGHIRSFAAFAAVTAACSLSFGLLSGVWAWLGLRVLNGLCIVGLYMVVESWLNEQTEGAARGRVFSVYIMSTLIGLGAGQLLLPVADPSTLALFAIASILVSVGMVPIVVTRVTEPHIRTAVPLRLRELVRISPLGVVGALSAGILSGAFWGMTPVFSQQLALSEAQIAGLMSATIFGGAALQWPIGHLSDRIDRRTVLIGASLATALVSAAVGFIVMGGHPGLLIAAFAFGGLMFSLYGISIAHANDHLQPGQTLEATRGLLLVFGFGALAGPLAAGLAMEWAGPVGLPALSTATALLLALYGAYRTRRRIAPPLADQGDFVAIVRTTPVALEMCSPDEEDEKSWAGG
jgi:MFS family permease